MPTNFSEATRVQIPAMVHLTRIGYTYYGKLTENQKGTIYDGNTNILLPVFEQQFKNLNPKHAGEWMQVLKDIRKELNDDDLGHSFYNRLKAVSPIKLHAKIIHSLWEKYSFQTPWTTSPANCHGSTAPSTTTGVPTNSISHPYAKTAPHPTPRTNSGGNSISPTWRSAHANACRTPHK